MRRLVAVLLLGFVAVGAFGSVRGVSGHLDPTGIPAQAIALARSRMGSPYVWGAAGPDTFDCSGPVQWVYGQLGIATSLA